MNFQIKYSSNSKNVQKTVKKLEVVIKKYGSVQVSSWSQRAGFLDLVTIIEIGIGWYIVEAAKNYAGGFIGLDWFKKLGEESRRLVLFQLEYLRSFLKDSFDEQIIGSDDHIEKAISLTIEVDEILLYVVLNHSKVNQDLVDTLPEGLARAICYLTSNNLGDDFMNVAQLYPNLNESSWDYLFVPSKDGLGNFVDRYIDLKTEKMNSLNSLENFVDKFGIGESDRYKLIIGIDYKL